MRYALLIEKNYKTIVKKDCYDAILDMRIEDAIIELESQGYIIYYFKDKVDDRVCVMIKEVQNAL